MAGKSKGNVGTLKEIQELLVGYAKQETIEPIKHLGRYLGWGIAGSLFMALGAIFLSLGVLRLLQSQTGSAFDGKSYASVVPYVITLVIAALFIAIIVLGVTRFRKAQGPRSAR